MKKKKTLEEDIADFLSYWDHKKQVEFVLDVIAVSELFDDEHGNWIREAVGDEDEKNVRMLRFVFLMSRMAEVHGSRIATINARFKGLWKRMQQESKANG